MGHIFTKDNLECLIKFGSISFGLLFFFGFWIYQHCKKKKHNLTDLFIVGMAGSSVPTGILMIYAAFDTTILQKLSDCYVYVAFAGASLIYIACTSTRERAK
jgi:hypothetical protein